MFFKKRIAVTDFGPILTEVFEQWASEAITKIAQEYRRPTKEELDRFSLAWMLHCGAFIAAELPREEAGQAGTWVLVTYLDAVHRVSRSKGLHFNPGSALEEAQHRADLYRWPPKDDQVSHAREDLKEILRYAFNQKKLDDKLARIAERFGILMDFTACQRNLIRILKRTKLLPPKLAKPVRIDRPKWF
jgi:hypothetical protein